MHPSNAELGGYNGRKGLKKKKKRESARTNVFVDQTALGCAWFREAVDDRGFCMLGSSAGSTLGAEVSHVMPNREHDGLAGGFVVNRMPCGDSVIGPPRGWASYQSC